PKKVMNESLGVDHARKSQLLVSSIILLKTALDSLPLLSKVLKEAKSSLLTNIYKSVSENEKYAAIRRRIGEVIDEDVLHARVPFVARTQQCFAVKAGIDGLLDIARRSFCDTSEGNEAWEQHSLLNSGTGFVWYGIYEFMALRPPTWELLERSSTYMMKVCTLQLNVRNKSAAGECFIRTEVCLEDHGPLAIDAGRHPILESIHNDFI
ncbi:hypothetical protein CRG98_038062, partial [Punica granatum]